MDFMMKHLKIKINLQFIVATCVKLLIIYYKIQFSLDDLNGDCYSFVGGKISSWKKTIKPSFENNKTNPLQWVIDSHYVDVLKRGLKNETSSVELNLLNVITFKRTRTMEHPITVRNKKRLWKRQSIPCFQIKHFSFLYKRFIARNRIR